MALDPLTLDQLRVFETVAETGSFSAAARRLRRAQSAVSYAIKNLETQLGVALFARGARPALTEAGRSLLADAHAVARKVDALRARARGLQQGLEPELALVVDVMFPMAALVDALDAFRREFPTVAVRLDIEALGAVAQAVLAVPGRIGIMGPLPALPDLLDGHALGAVTLVSVVAPSHPLAAWRGPIPTASLRDHVQLVLTDRSALTDGIEVAVLSTTTWRTADLGAKHALLRAGLGWGNLPAHLAADDLAAGRLVRIAPAEWNEASFRVPMLFVHRADAPLGPAARWFYDRLRQCAEAAEPRPTSETPTRSVRRRSRRYKRAG
jgi:DNA-binding transcriptional LysR family regulator